MASPLIASGVRQLSRVGAISQSVFGEGRKVAITPQELARTAHVERFETACGHQRAMQRLRVDLDFPEWHREFRDFSMDARSEQAVRTFPR